MFIHAQVTTDFPIEINCTDSDFGGIQNVAGTQFTITGLYASVNYSISVRASTSKGFGPYNTTTAFTRVGSELMNHSITHMLSERCYKHPVVAASCNTTYAFFHFMIVQ